MIRRPGFPKWHYGSLPARPTKGGAPGLPPVRLFAQRVCIARLCVVDHVFILRALKEWFDLALKTCILGGPFAAISAGIWSSSVIEAESLFGVLIYASLSFVPTTAASFVFVFRVARANSDTISQLGIFSAVMTAIASS